jgi:Nose resistant-to-fluoxetine protein, N-terminal domain
MAKIPTGIMEGKLSWLGSYDKCEEYSVNYNYSTANGSQTSVEARQFQGQYCRLDIAVAVNACCRLQLYVKFTIKA